MPLSLSWPYVHTQYAVSFLSFFPPTPFSHFFFGLSCLGPSGHNQGQLSAAYAYILSDFLPIVLNQLAVELFIELAPRTTMYRYDTHILIRRPRRASYRSLVVVVVAHSSTNTNVSCSNPVEAGPWVMTRVYVIDLGFT